MKITNRYNYYGQGGRIERHMVEITFADGNYGEVGNTDDLTDEQWFDLAAKKFPQFADVKPHAKGKDK